MTPKLQTKLKNMQETNMGANVASKVEKTPEANMGRQSCKQNLKNAGGQYGTLQDGFRIADYLELALCTFLSTYEGLRSGMIIYVLGMHTFAPLLHCRAPFTVDPEIR